MRVFAGDTIAWVTFLVLWVCNNSYWNLPHVRFLHKVLTLVLVFKTLGIYASFSLYMSCPFERVSSSLLQLARDQFQTLYKTSFLCLLLTLSKGLFLVRSELTRSELNHIAVLVSMSYISVSAYNLMKTELVMVLGGLYVVVGMHCVVFSCRVLAVIREQIEGAERARMREMEDIWKVKKWRFWVFAVTVQSYLLGLLTVTIIVKDWSFGLVHSHYSVYAVNIGVQETLEFCLMSLIFLLYRAKPEPRLFHILTNGQPPRYTHLYTTSLFHCEIPISKSVVERQPVVIVNPGQVWDEKCPFRGVTLGIVTGDKPGEGKVRRTQIEMTENSRR